MKNEIIWCAIGDSFTYINDHLEETDNRLTKGYLTLVCEAIPQIQVINRGINGSTTKDWLNQPVQIADVYTIMLGTNDWKNQIQVGDKYDYITRRTGTILGNLGDLVERIHKIAQNAPIIIMNPVERADFVYLFNHKNNFHGSYRQAGGQLLKDISKKIVECCMETQVYPLDIYHLSGFNQNNLIQFKRLKVNDTYLKLPYPDYIDIPYDPDTDEYPYPIEAGLLTYDGLHPSDEGCRRIADVLTKKMKEVLLNNEEAS